MSLIDDAIDELRVLIMINQLITKKRSTYRKRSMTVTQIEEMTKILEKTITELEELRDKEGE